MGKYEVTQAEYEKYCSYTGSNSPSSDYGDGDNYPAYYVSWYDALVYCNKRSIAEGLPPCYSISGNTDPSKWGTAPTSINSAWDAVVCDWEANGYRLPTEAEWEYAARAGDNTVEVLTYSGTSDVNNLGEYAWYANNSGATTHPVGTKKSNAFGLYDMTGNVWEWCWDWGLSDYDTETEGCTDPTGALSGTKRIGHGGAWNSYTEHCPVSFRNSSSTPYTRNNVRGFRVVRSAVAKEKELTFTVTFDTLGGSSVEKQEVEKDKTVTEPAKPTKKGYVFAGWYTSSTEGTILETEFDFTTPITSNLTLYAKWIQGTDTAYVVQHYKQNLEDNNYTLDVSESKTGTTDTMTSSIPKDYEGFTHKTIEEKTILANGTTVVKIYYDRNIYTVSFSNDRVISETQSVKYEKVATEPTNPTKEGYIFFGWYTSTDGGNTLSTKFDFTTEITNNLTLYAKWETNFTSSFGSITVTTNDTCVILSNSNYLTETSVYDSYVVSEISYPIEANTNYKISVDIKLDSEKEVMLDFCDSLHDNIDLKKSITVGTEWQTIELETGTWQGDWNGSFKLYTGTIEEIYLKNFKIETLETSILPVAVYHSSISKRFEDGFTIDIDDDDGWIAIGGQKAEYGNIYRIDFDLLATNDVKINCCGKISTNYAETGACHQISANDVKHFTLFIPHMGSDSGQEFDFISLGFWDLEPTTITISDFTMKIAAATDLAQIDPVYLMLNWTDGPIKLTPCENGEYFETHNIEPGNCVISERNGPFVMTQENEPLDSFVWDGNYIDSRTIIKNDNSTNYELILDNEGLRYYVKNVSNKTISCKFWINKLYQLVVEEY